MEACRFDCCDSRPFPSNEEGVFDDRKEKGKDLQARRSDVNCPTLRPTKDWLTTDRQVRRI